MSKVIIINTTVEPSFAIGHLESSFPALLSKRQKYKLDNHAPLIREAGQSLIAAQGNFKVAKVSSAVHQIPHMNLKYNVMPLFSFNGGEFLFSHVAWEQG